MWGLSLAKICSLHNCIHPPGMELSSLKTACGWVIIFVLKTTVTHNPLTPLHGTHLSVYNCSLYTGWPQSVHQFSVLERNLLIFEGLSHSLLTWRYSPVNVSMRFEWQTMISQSACADETLQSFDCLFRIISFRNALSPTELGWLYTSEWEKCSSRSFKHVGATTLTLLSDLTSMDGAFSFPDNTWIAYSKSIDMLV